MHFALFDTVILTRDRPDAGLRAGARGAIIGVFDKPEVAYEVEFCDNDGRTLAELALSADELAPDVSALRS